MKFIQAVTECRRLKTIFQGSQSHLSHSGIFTLSRIGLRLGRFLIQISHDSANTITDNNRKESNSCQFVTPRPKWVKIAGKTYVLLLDLEANLVKILTISFQFCHCDLGHWSGCDCNTNGVMEGLRVQCWARLRQRQTNTFLDCRRKVTFHLGYCLAAFKHCYWSTCKDIINLIQT